MNIRPERQADHNAIGSVVRAAFKKDVEARLVDDLRSSGDFITDLSLVAEIDGEIVGHVMVTWVTLADGDTTHRILSLAPLAVAPDHQGRGVGSALMAEAITRADAMGEPMIVLQGSPVYYSRFGFEPSAPLGVTMDLPDWAMPEAAQLVRLSSYDPSIRGRVIYPPAFDSVD